MTSQHSNRTPARSQRASTDAPNPKKRKRCRMFGLVRQNKNLTAADARVLEKTLRDLPLKAWVFGRHGASTGCVDCAGTEEHLQAAIRFVEVRDLHVVEQNFPGYKVIPLVGATAWRNYVKYLSHERAHEVTASFDFEEFLAKYGGTPVKSLLYRDIKRMVYEGEMTLLEVHRDHREVYINHWRALEALAEKGEEMREAERATKRAESEAAAQREAERAEEAWARLLRDQPDFAEHVAFEERQRLIDEETQRQIDVVVFLAEEAEREAAEAAKHLEREKRERAEQAECWRERDRQLHEEARQAVERDNERRRRNSKERRKQRELDKEVAR